MVAWYKHDIPAWMDGTESLTDGEYRAYHVICQLIYLNEGPIMLNEHGIAGRCKMHILTFRRSLAKLVELEKLHFVDGRLSNDRAATELQSVANHRATSAKGGRGSAGVAKRSVGGSEEVGRRLVDGCEIKPLKINSSATVTLLDHQHQETRLEETREEKKESCAVAKATRPKYPEKFEEAFAAYPRREGGNPKAPAAKHFLAAIKAGADPQSIVDGVKRYALAEQKNIGTPYIPQMLKWLKDWRWLDYSADAAIIKFDVRKHLA